MPKIFIERPSELINGRTPYQIYINDKKVGTVENGENNYFEVEQGEHTVVAKMNFFMGGSPVLATVKNNEVRKLKVTGSRGALWILGLGAISMLLIMIQDYIGISGYVHLILPGIFLLYFLTIGRKKHLSLAIEE